MTRGANKLGENKIGKRDLRRELVADIEQIEDNVCLYRAGRNSAYQAVAIQLRNILLGGRRALLARVVREPRLHEFRPSEIPPEELEAFRRDPSSAMILDVRGGIELSTASPGAQVELEFTDDLLPLGSWLRQWIIRPDVTIERLIKEVADEEVAHTQEEIGRTVARTQDFIFGGAASGRQMRHMVVVALGEYIAGRVRALI
jgi:hypothetical protein